MIWNMEAVVGVTRKLYTFGPLQPFSETLSIGGFEYILFLTASKQQTDAPPDSSL